MALESLEGIEEERRLFYVALTRAKSLATLSCADMRFRWGQMNFSTPSRFLNEIDSQFVECDFDLKNSRRGREQDGDQGEDAITTLRRRYDVRHQEQKRTQPQPQNQPPRPTYNTDRLRRVEGSASGATTSLPCTYSVGQRVSHPKFGMGTISAIEPLSTDHKLTINFEAFGAKTLLAKLAKLTVL